MTAFRKVGTVFAATAAAVVLGAGTALAAPVIPVVAVNDAGTINPNNSVTVSGTIVCPVGNGFFGSVKVRQPGRVPNAALAAGVFFGPATPVPCTGVPQPWVVTTGAGTKPFVPGVAEVEALFTTNGPVGVGSKLVFEQVLLA